MAWRRKWQPHFRILVWEILWTEEPSRLQSIRSQRVSHNWVNTHTHTHTHTHTRSVNPSQLYKNQTAVGHLTMQSVFNYLSHSLLAQWSLKYSKVTHKLTIVYTGLCKDVCLLLTFQCVWVQSENSPHFKWKKERNPEGLIQEELENWLAILNG